MSKSGVLIDQDDFMKILFKTFKAFEHFETENTAEIEDMRNKELNCFYKISRSIFNKVNVFFDQAYDKLYEPSYRDTIYPFLFFAPSKIRDRDVIKLSTIHVTEAIQILNHRVKELFEHDIAQSKDAAEGSIEENMFISSVYVDLINTLASMNVNEGLEIIYLDKNKINNSRWMENAIRTLFLEE